MEWIAEILSKFGATEYAVAGAAILVALATIAKVVTKFTANEKDDVVADKAYDIIKKLAAQLDASQPEEPEQEEE
jgi:hypothetical protein